MNIAKKLPIELIWYILTYDRRYVIRDRKLIMINNLDKNKYAQIIDLLLKKKIPVCKCTRNIYGIYQSDITIELNRINLSYRFYNYIDPNEYYYGKLTICNFTSDYSYIQVVYLY